VPFGIPEPVVALAVFLIGVGLVIVSVEAFVETVSAGALALGVSTFFLTVLLAGMDLENAILGLAAVVRDLPGLALGTVFGEALFVLGVAVGVAGVLTPFETTVPRSYLLLAAVSPALLILLAADGTLSRLDGVVLTLAFLPLVAAVYVLERGTSTRYLSAEEVEEIPEEEDDDIDRGWLKVVTIFLTVAGMTVGSELAVRGARDLLAVFGVSGLAFGATLMSFIASIEELFLTVEPIRQGHPHLGVGNVVGSVLFFMTANAGLIALVGPIPTDGAVVTVHWPFLLVALGLVVATLFRGRVGRLEGGFLLVVYAGYWGMNLLA
jgi:cation:H+ antiporter